jgi:peptide/nickel transport system substrate-binding protein
MKQKMFFLLSLLVVASMILAACGPADSGNNMADNDMANDSSSNTGDTSGDAAGDAADAGMAAPPFKNADTYVYVTPGDPETLDPHWTYETAGSGVQNNIYEGLVWFNRERTDSFVPILSTGWEANDAGDVWTFTIRDGVTFHAGGTLEPHDVAYSMWRALLQDRIDGPHWMTHEAFFGTYAMEDTLDAAVLAAEYPDGDAPEDREAVSIATATPEQLVLACEAVKAVAVADDAAGTVTFNLNAPTPWIMALFANNFVGNVLDQEWMADNGGWDGSCDTWADYHDPAAEESILFDQANGTGPYMLDHWTPGEEIVLVANPNYWRADDNPIWEGGPSGVASIQRVVYTIVDEWGTRLAMFEAGDADFVTTDPQYYSQIEPEYGVVCEPDGTCEDRGGWMQVFDHIQRPAMTPAQFNQAINNEGGNVFMGSGELDGNGIPSDFFADLHVRRAFSFCFDYATFIDEGLAGQGAQAQGPIIAGMMGYRDDGYVFSYDPEACAAEFQASETGVWDTGFYMQIAYNTGNDTRRLAAEVLKAGIESVNPSFQIQVVGMPWPVLLGARRAGKLPIYVGGWLEDFHDPHNWVHPFLHSQGAYGRVANIQEPLASEFDAMIEQAAALTSADERRPIYEELQLMAQEEAVMIWLYQPLARYHFSPSIQGWYYNAAYPTAAFSYIYALEKVGP